MMDLQLTHPDGIAKATTPAPATTASIGIVGGGKIGLQLFKLFSESHLTRVAYVVDRQLMAPARVAAQQARVATYSDVAAALRGAPADFVFEVTGVPQVAESLRQALAGSRTQLVTHDTAYTLLTVIEEARHTTTGRVRADMVNIQAEIVTSLGALAGVIGSIKQTMSDLQYLALNARIEAAHAGEFGRGFDIVAQQMERTAQAVHDMTTQMETANANVGSVAERIEQSLSQLN